MFVATEGKLNTSFSLPITKSQLAVQICIISKFDANVGLHEGSNF